MPGPKITARMDLDGRGFEAGLKGMTGKLQSFTNNAKGMVIGALGVGSIEEFVRRTGSKMIEIRNAAKQFQITTDEVQQLGKAAGKSGLEFEDFGTAMDKMGTARVSAIEDSQKLRNTFERYGITLKDLQDPQIRNIDLLKKMSAAIRENGGEMTARDRANFRELFGKSGAKLIESLKELDSKDDKLIKKEDIERVYQATRAIKALGKEIQLLGAGPIGTVAGAAAIMLKYGRGQGKKDMDEAHEYIMDVDRKSLNPGQDEFLRDQVLKYGKAQKDFDIPKIDEHMANILAFKKDKGFRPKGYYDEGANLGLADDGDLVEAGQTLEGKRQKETDTELLKLEERIFEMRRKSLTPLEQQQALMKEISKHIADAQGLENIGLDWEGAQERIEAAQKAGELTSLYGQDTFKPVSDQLSNVGGFTGASGRMQTSGHDIKNKVQTVIDLLQRGIPVHLRET